MEGKTAAETIYILGNAWESKLICLFVFERERLQYLSPAMNLCYCVL